MRKPIKKPVIHEIPKHNIERGDITARAKGHRPHVYHPTKGWRLARSHDGADGRDKILDFICAGAGKPARAITGSNGELRGSKQHRLLLAKRADKQARRKNQLLLCNTVKWA